MKRKLPALVIAITFAVPLASSAQEQPPSLEPPLNEPPRGPGTRELASTGTETARIRPGWEAGAQVGGGIGLGFGARAGYSFAQGVYAGGSLLHFLGSEMETMIGADSQSQTIFGADLGYEIYPLPDLELRPFLFTGFGVFNQYDRRTTLLDQSISITIAPAFLAAYHFGKLFVSAEARAQVAPAPARFAVLGGVGVGL